MSLKDNLNIRPKCRQPCPRQCLRGGSTRGTQSPFVTLGIEQNEHERNLHTIGLGRGPRADTIPNWRPHQDSGIRRYITHIATSTHANTIQSAAATTPSSPSKNNPTGSSQSGHWATRDAAASSSLEVTSRTQLSKWYVLSPNPSPLAVLLTDSLTGRHRRPAQRPRMRSVRLSRMFPRPPPNLRTGPPQRHRSGRVLRALRCHRHPGRGPRAGGGHPR